MKHKYILRIFSFVLVIIIIISLSVFVFADSPIEFADSLVGVDKETLPFDTSSPWCVRFARWFNQQYGVESYSDYNECNFVANDDVLKINNQDELHVFDWVLLDTDYNGFYNHCVVYLGNNTYVGGNENGSVGIHYSEFDYPFVGIRARVASPVADTRVVSPVVPSDANGFKAVMLNLIGDYDAIVNEYSYVSSNGYVNYIREITPDYVWMISAGIFIVVLWCIFRLTAFLVGGGKRR